MITLAKAGVLWKSGHYQSVAVLNLSHSELSSLLGGIELSNGTEPGLGSWQAAGLVLQSGLQLELISYTDAPKLKGFEVRLDAAVDSESGLKQVLSELGIDDSRVIWRRGTNS